jgi:hypothetical protein
MPSFFARGTVVRYKDSRKYKEGVSESIHVAEVFLQISRHSSAVGCRRTVSALSERGSLLDAVIIMFIHALFV